MKRPLLTVLLVVQTILSAGCSVWNLGYIPADLVRAMGASPETPPRQDAGPVESALQKAARQSRQLGWLVDTAEPENDLKQLARRCDQGDDLACERLGTPLVFFLDERALGISLWQRACASGAARACRMLADFLAREYLPEHDAEHAAELYERGCTLEAHDRRACWVAARQYRDQRGDLFFVYADRACELGGWDACSAVREFTEPRDPKLAESYRFLADRSNLTEAKRALVRALEAEAFGAEVNRLLGGYLHQINDERRREHCRAFDDGSQRSWCEGTMFEGGIPTRWRPDGEVPERCLTCVARCTSDGRAIGGSQVLCFCKCATDAGGCSLDGELLNRCLSDGDLPPDRRSYY